MGDFIWCLYSSGGQRGGSYTLREKPGTQPSGFHFSKAAGLVPGLPNQKTKAGAACKWTRTPSF